MSSVLTGEKVLILSEMEFQMHVVDNFITERLDLPMDEALVSECERIYNYHPIGPIKKPHLHVV